MPRRPRRLLLAAACAVLGACVLGLAPAGASATAPSGVAQTPGRAGRATAVTAARSATGGIDVIQLNGLLDPPNADLIHDTIAAANRGSSSLVVITVSSSGSLRVNPSGLLDDIRHSAVPVAVWVGPSGASARGAAAVLAQAASVVSVGSGATLGPAFPVRLDVPSSTNRSSLASLLEGLARGNGRNPKGAAWTATHSLSAHDAVIRGAADDVCAGTHGCPTLGDFVVGLDGRTVKAAGADVTLSTAKVVGHGDQRRRQPNQEVRFRKLTLGGIARHTLANPSIAYFLFVVGLALIVFELFTISIGLAGGAGALALVGAGVGFSNLPVVWWAVALLILAILGYAIDVQVGKLGPWSAIATVCAPIGSFALFGGSSRLDVHWWVVVLVVVALIVFMVLAMPVAVRSRFSTPFVSREGLKGELGVAAVDLDPDGIVVLRDARWRARADTAEPIRQGDPIRVVAADGFVLGVEPQGGAVARGNRRDPGPEAPATPGAS